MSDEQPSNTSQSPQSWQDMSSVKRLGVVLANIFLIPLVTLWETIAAIRKNDRHEFTARLHNIGEKIGGMLGAWAGAGIAIAGFWTAFGGPGSTALGQWLSPLHIAAGSPLAIGLSVLFTILITFAGRLLGAPLGVLLTDIDGPAMAQAARNALLGEAVASYLGSKASKNFRRRAGLVAEFLWNILFAPLAAILNFIRALRNNVAQDMTQTATQRLAVSGTIHTFVALVGTLGVTSFILVAFLKPGVLPPGLMHLATSSPLAIALSVLVSLGCVIVARGLSATLGTAIVKPIIAKTRPDIPGVSQVSVKILSGMASEVMGANVAKTLREKFGGQKKTRVMSGVRGTPESVPLTAKDEHRDLSDSDEEQHSKETQPLLGEHEPQLQKARSDLGQTGAAMQDTLAHAPKPPSGQVTSAVDSDQAVEEAGDDAAETPRSHSFSQHGSDKGG